MLLCCCGCASCPTVVQFLSSHHKVSVTEKPYLAVMLLMIKSTCDAIPMNDACACTVLGDSKKITIMIVVLKISRKSILSR